MFHCMLETSCCSSTWWNFCVASHWGWGPQCSLPQKDGTSLKTKLREHSFDIFFPSLLDIHNVSSLWYRYHTMFAWQESHNLLLVKRLFDSYMLISLKRLCSKTKGMSAIAGTHQQTCSTSGLPLHRKYVCFWKAQCHLKGKLFSMETKMGKTIAHKYYKYKAFKSCRQVIINCWTQPHPITELWFLNSDDISVMRVNFGWQSSSCWRPF